MSFWKPPLLHLFFMLLFLTQQTSTLLKLLFPPHPLVKPFFFTKLSSAFPFELKLSDLIHILPHKSFPKVKTYDSYLPLLYVSKMQNFTLTSLLTSVSFSFILKPLFLPLLCPFPPPSSMDFFFLKTLKLSLKPLKNLPSTLSLSHTLLNTFQAKFLDKTECITLHIPIIGKVMFDKVTESLSSLSNAHSFLFSSIFSAMYSNPDDAYFNYFSLYKIDPTPIIHLFNHCNIPYFQSHTYILFKASPSTLEESLLLASDLDIVIPTSFISNTHKLVFEFSSEILTVRLLDPWMSIFSNFKSLGFTLHHQ